MHSHSPRRLALALCLAGAACTQSPSGSTGSNGVTAATHEKWFPIGLGAAHELGHLTRDDGPVACSSCHPPGADSFTAFSCTTCHAHEETATRRIHAGVSGFKYESQACYQCHGGQDGSIFATGSVPVGLFFEPANSVTLTALIPRYTATSISSVSPLVETLPMPMDHASKQLPPGALSECSNCHANASSSTFLPGLLHSSLANLTVAQPSSCDSCHLASAPTGFVGPLATRPPRLPATGEMKHDAVAWTNGAPGTAALVPADCGLCHGPPATSQAASWATGIGGEGLPRYHASLDVPPRGQPGSCLDCHANSRPVGALTSANATLPPGMTFDHADGPGLADCVACHASTTAWSGAQFHAAGSRTPTTCLPCHQGERPTSNTGWINTTYQLAPFDYGTNVAGVTHGGGQDCVTCHAGPGSGAWGGTQNWARGLFVHGPGTHSTTTCLDCHWSQRPDLVLGVAGAKAVLPGAFDHSQDGAGECLGCHQATVNAGTYARYFNAGTGVLPNGDWKGGQLYPGSFLTGSLDQAYTVTEYTLLRSGALVTGMTQLPATHYNGMLHTASVLPPQLAAGPSGSPNSTTCWHCHTSTGTTVSAFKNGLYHQALTRYAASPGGTAVPFPQPTTGCSQCHAAGGPQNIVLRGASTLFPMDHSAQFVAPVTIGGVTAAGVAQLDCSTCHRSPGTVWSDGVFHARIGGAVPRDCVSCHYPLMANVALADVSGGAGGVDYAMKHRSAQLTTQACETCHLTALQQAATANGAVTGWRLGTLHAGVPAQPASCLECHAASEPRPNASTQSAITYVLVQGATASNGGQWMNHGASYVASKDCVVCHAADARKQGSAWSKSTSFHGTPRGVTTCKECHGFDNGGGAVAGARNNLPQGLITSTTVSSAGAEPTTGIPAGTRDQLLHTDVNVAGRDCSACHLQLGPSTVPGLQGHEWAQGSFHTSFSALTPLVMNGTTGRCSNCHLNVKPAAGYPKQDHGPFSGVSGTKDCASCHAWPGLGTQASPDWKGAQGMPPYLSVGGFTVSSPPAGAGAVQAGINLLPHPTPAATDTCVTCHATPAGGTGAKGYDHPAGLIDSNCGACHEAGSPLVASPWNGATAEALGAGDTRPFTLTQVTAQHGGGMVVKAPNHFFPVDCNQCHVSPGGLGFTTTGTAYTITAWSFPHDQLRMTNPGTCVLCHTNGIPGAPSGLASDPKALVTLAELLPRYVGTTLASFTPVTDELSMSMLHSSKEFSAAANSACSNCHTGASSGAYYPGTLHASLAALKLAQPTACASCHADALPPGFVGPTATSPARSPASGEMKHDAVAWASGAPTATRLVSTNCGQCHVSPSETLQATWALGRTGTAPAKYHPALAAAAQAQPGSCLDCHANTRPGTVLTSANAALPAGLVFDHSAPATTGDCQTCHARSAVSPWTQWTGGQFHLAGGTSPASCLPCHTGERPTSAAGWKSTTYTSSPFDYGTNSAGVTHGDGQDCAVCHAGPGTGAWGGTQNWVGGKFVHGPATVSASTCVACHLSQRPDLVLGAAASTTAVGFDHAANGTGECAGCHQATATAGTYVNYFNPSTRTLPNGDWKGGVAYPGEFITHSTDQYITVDETRLVRSGTANLVTSSTLLPAQKLSNGMLHTSTALPAVLNAGTAATADFTKCWHCHTSTGTTVTSFANGQYHSILATYRATPGGSIVAQPQPTTCLDCHAQMLPTVGLVKRGGSNLLAMDHAAQFAGPVTIGGKTVTSVSQLDCAACHRQPGTSWADGVFHASLGGAAPGDCVSCHYLLMADKPTSDKASGSNYAMAHGSTTLTFQRCDTCHAGALAKATGAATAAQWAPGAFHPSASPQPTRCYDCHGVSEPLAAAPTQSSMLYTLPLGGTSSNSGQWLNHATAPFSSGGAVVDCVGCHAADARASGSAWSKATLFHPTHPGLTTCDGCHGIINHSPASVLGSGTLTLGVPGTTNNMPTGLTNSTTVTGASGTPNTGIPAGTHDQVSHADYNVLVTKCQTCHTQQGASTATGVQGKEWTVAKFHAAFTTASPLVMNATGRCSNCHLNVRPGTAFTAQAHAAFTATSATDCSSCHAYPGTGTAAAPNWVTSAVPSTIASGGFTISKPPAANTTTTQAPAPISLPHPTVGTQACTVCHLASSGGRPAKGYDHYPASGKTKLTVTGTCSPCHEAGSTLVTPVWNSATTAASGLGDTRPISLATIVPSFQGNRTAIPAVNHFYPTDCFACHTVPTGNGIGLVYLTAWKFKHNETNMKGACTYCHPPIPKG